MEEKEIQALVMAGVDKEVNLRPLNGFKLDFSANPGFKKVFFSASCDCGTAALLSLEVSEEKTDSDIEAALPSLIQRIDVTQEGKIEVEFYINTRALGNTSYPFCSRYEFHPLVKIRI